ncbi:MAG: hypothetical protein KAH21_05835 [Spirochaetaceae bacterium]|nr:hypothetical protein [Spirochaetaceae bacterium]
MTKPLLLSAAIHIFILGFLFLSVALDTIDTSYIETITIKIRNQSISGRYSERVKASSPSESNRSIRKAASIPSSQISRASLAGNSILSYQTAGRKSAELSEIRISDVPLPGVNDSIRTETLHSLDPLEGFEDQLSEEAAESDLTGNPWSFSWANGNGRDILSYPIIKPEEFPEETEHLLNISVTIMVSPQGDVLSAEVQAPGSGDIRIDRRIHNLALELVLEPWPEEKGAQEGLLRLMFLDGSR